MQKDIRLARGTEGRLGGDVPVVEGSWSLGAAAAQGGGTEAQDPEWGAAKGPMATEEQRHQKSHLTCCSFSRIPMGM